jgi:hypothetical protein
MDEAQDVFKLEEQLSTFRHVVSGHLTTEGNCKIIIQFFLIGLWYRPRSSYSDVFFF